MTTTVVSRLHDHARERPDDPAYGQVIDGAWQTTSWRTYKNQVRRVARALMALGVAPGDRVAVLGFNRPEWVQMALGAMACRGVVVGVYTTCSAEQVAYIVGHAQVPVLLIEDQAQWAKVEAERATLPDLRHVVTMRGAHLRGATGEDPAIGWDAFLARADDVDEEALDARMAATEESDLATLIYTSGTTGFPKGVMLSHGNVVETSRLTVGLFDYRSSDSALSYLPLAHIAEQMISIHISVYVGCTIYYVASPERLADDLKTLEPTIFFGVPRVWERFHAAVTAKLAQAPASKRALLRWAAGVGRKVSALRHRGQEPRGLLAVQAKAAERLVLAKVRGLLGFGKLRMAASGAAPIAREILEFFSGLGITVYEVYGLSESCGPGTWNRPGATRLGSVGQVLPEVEIRLEDDGEVCLRGPNVFQGYFESPEQTAETLQGTWLHTGDLGALDDDGYLTITGRKKEIIITSGGKNIAPAGIESRLKEIELVADAVVIGNDRRYLSALLSLEPEAAQRFAATQGLDAATLHESDTLRATLEVAVEGVNAHHARVEHVRAFRVLPRPLSVEDGELTPTLKMKRDVIHRRWMDLIGSMYEQM